jgi:hypothetical protein
MKENGAVFPDKGRCIYVRSIIKVLFGFNLVMLCGPVFSQSNYQVLSKIDNLVQQIDSLANKSQRTFYLNKIDKEFDGVKETWNYTMRDGKVVVFQVRFIIDSIEYIEIYYLNRGALIYSEEYETLYYTSTGDDEIKWGGIYYFVSNSLRQGVTLGDRRRKYQSWNPEIETLSRFQKRFSELQENLPLTARNYK